MSVGAKARAELIDCELRANGSNAGAASVAVKAGGQLSMQRGSIVDAYGGAISLAEGSSAELARCEIMRAAKVGVAARGVAALLIEECVVAEGGAAGIMLLQGGAAAVLRGNTIRGNANSGVQLSELADPLIEGNSICNGGRAGIFIFQNGRGRLAGNKISANGGAGIRVEESAPRIEHNQIYDGHGVGISIAGRAPCGRGDGGGGRGGGDGGGDGGGGGGE